MIYRQSCVIQETFFDAVTRYMDEFKIVTRKREELIDITASVADILSSAGVSSGICVLYCPHTTAAITINEGADPDVASDIIIGLARLVPSTWPFAHLEGNSDAHLKASLVGPSQTVMIRENEPVLGTWQRIFFCEFDGPRTRSVLVKIVEG